jgi:uncharacterized protein (TIGR01319 family)
MKTNPKELKTILVTDCGSTTTKALLFEKTLSGWRQTYRGEAPTTVEEPVADVTVGARNAFIEIEELSNRKILKNTNNPNDVFIISEKNNSEGIDLYLSTSSAGGGLQMLVAGLVSTMSAESAERAALGAGAIVLDVVAADDGREDHERIERIRHVRPDIVLLTGGTDGGSKSHVLEVAELLLAAAPRPRFGDTLRLPVIYAGNKDASDEILEILENFAQVKIVENVRPNLETENLQPAREAIHDFFLTHVMSHSPGYDKLLTWTPVPIVPTPSAVGAVIERYAKSTHQQVLCADIGGATTDVFSVCKDKSDNFIFNRTVSANYGMSYSIANVLIDAGVNNIKRWLPYKISENEIRDRLRNKMIRPTSIPQTLEDLWLEQAVCREALRLSLEHHSDLAVGLSGVQQKRGIADIFSQSVSRYKLLDPMKLDVVIGSGGVLSHAPNRMSAALMMIDGFGLEGVTEICVDSIFMMPHLGVLANIHPEASVEIFTKDCLIKVCHSIIPVASANAKISGILAKVEFNGKPVGEILSSEIIHINCESEKEGILKVIPTSKHINVGNGYGEEFSKVIITGQNGFLLDGRKIINFNSKINTEETQKKIWVNLKLN